MLRRELIFLHSASGDGCNDRPLLLTTPEDFYRPVCIGSTRAFASPACPPNRDAGRNAVLPRRSGALLYSREPASNPCSAYTAPTRVWESSSAGGRCSEPPFDGCRSRGSGPRGRDIRHSVRRPKPEMAAPVPCTRACAGSKPRRPAGPQLCALRSPWPVPRSSTVTTPSSSIPALSHFWMRRMMRFSPILGYRAQQPERDLTLG